MNDFEFVFVMFAMGIAWIMVGIVAMLKGYAFYSIAGIAFMIGGFHCCFRLFKPKNETKRVFSKPKVEAETPEPKEEKE